VLSTVTVLLPTFCPRPSFVRAHRLDASRAPCRAMSYTNLILLHVKQYPVSRLYLAVSPELAVSTASAGVVVGKVASAAGPR